jgi:pimeloyl-ACP methyl ester carboxylesterase
MNDRYNRLGAPQQFFREPREISPNVDLKKSLPGGVNVIDVHWPSDYATFLPEVREQYSRVVENRTATARLIAHETPRPLVVLIHGYLGGAHRVERWIWPTAFLRRLGLDVALFVLPFHGRRAEPGVARPIFPGAEPRLTNEGFRQAMADFRDLFAWLEKRGHPQIGVMGMSLGGYSTALAATLEPKLAFAVPMIPLASIADVARAHGHLRGSAEAEEAEHRALALVHRPVSPLHRPLAIAPERALIIAAERDQITPIEHARKLAEHFRCRIETMPGSHLVQLGRNDKFRSFGRFLNELGIVTRAERT